MAKRKIETKKAIVFIVEGRTDKIALEKIFQRIYQNFKFVYTPTQIRCKSISEVSWSYIREELHSLERHTNLHLYFTDNPY